MMPIFSILLPMYNEMDSLPICIGSIFQSIAGNNQVEVIIADNGSDDGCIQAAEELGATVLTFHGETIAALRNHAARAAKGRYLLFIDSDIAVPKSWFSSIQSRFESSETDVFAFVDIAPESAPWFARRWAERALARRNTTRRADYLPGRNIYLKSEWFHKVGGFDESLVTGEDKDFVMRLSQQGANVFTVHEPLITHYGYEKTWKEWFKKEYWRQHNHPDLWRKQGFTVRNLRFPLVALLHLPLFALSIAALVLLPEASLPLLTLWGLPAVLMAVHKPYSRRSFFVLWQFTLLYWLRFHVTAFSTIIALIKQREHS